MKWQYTKDPIRRQCEDYIGDGFIGRIISDGQHPECKWYDTPSQLRAANSVTLNPEPANELEFLTKKAATLGIKIDKRWGAKKIQEAIDGYGS